jgi:hypothetical protein
MAVGLTVAFILSQTSTGNAGSAERKANASYRSGASAPVSRAAGQTPANCVRESCGRLWCWKMKGETTKSH